MDQKTQDNVNNPVHYGGADNPYEVIKVIEAWGLDGNFNLGNTVKYVARAEHKNNNVEDLKKARWYLDREIAKLEGVPDPNQGNLFNKQTKDQRDEQSNNE
jgi:hypothetical protein